MYLIEENDLALAQYTHDDDHDMYLCWQDEQTQKGYNYVFDQPLERFKKTDITRFPFWVTVTDRTLDQRVGVLRLGLDEKHPDLAIWIYPQHRSKGYGTRACRLALKFIFQHLPYQEIAAGCYCDNKHSLAMLEKVGFSRRPEEDEPEINCFTGEKTIQLAFGISKAELNG